MTGDFVCPVSAAPAPAHRSEASSAREDRSRVLTSRAQRARLWAARARQPKTGLRALGLAHWLLVGVAVGSTACGPDAPPAPDDSTLIDGRYANPFFGLQLQVPSGWSVASAEANTALAESGTQAMAGDSDERQATLDAMRRDSYQLLTISEHPIGSRAASNSMLQIVAERLGDDPRIRTAEDYLEHVATMLESSQLPYERASEIPPQKLGGRTFSAAAFELELPGARLRQRYYTTLTGGFALSIGVTFADEAERDSLESILESIQLE